MPNSYQDNLREYVRITQTEIDRIAELGDHVERMRQNDKEFIMQMQDKIDEYGLRTFFSDGQRSYLRTIEERYLT